MAKSGMNRRAKSGKVGKVVGSNDDPLRTKSSLKGFKSAKKRGSIVSATFTEDRESRGHVNSDN